MQKILKLIRPDLQDFHSYSSARDEAKQGRIWLNANESPYPVTGPANILLNRYPEKQPAAVIKQLAEIYQVTAEQITMLRGSDEAIDLLVRLFCTAGQDAVMICPPTFGMYKVYAQLQGAKTIAVPLLAANNFQLDMSAIKQQWQPNVKMIFLCSPNNPTGTIVSSQEIFSLCEYFADKCLIVVDEAYIEFSTAESVAKHIKKYPNLVVLRTFSKAYGLAGVRCGLLLAQAEITAWILKIVSPYPLPSLTINAIAEHLTPSQLQLMREHIGTIKSERERLLSALQALPNVKKVWPSDANFLLFQVQDAKKVMMACAEQGIVLRNMSDKPGLENCIRISIGLPEENLRAITVMQQVR